VSRWVVSACAMVAVVGLTVQVDAGRIDEVATLVAKNCVSVTRLAMTRAENRAPGVVAAEIWMSGESCGDVRVALWKDDHGNVFAERVSIPAGNGSACAQLKRLYKANLSLSPADAAEHIHVETTTFAGEEKPVLSALLEEAATLTLHTTLSDSIFFPSRNVQLEISNGTERVLVEFHEPDTSVEGVAYSGSLEASQPEASDWVDKLLRATAPATVESADR